MKRPRGDNQGRILDFIKSEILSRGYPPSVREICDAVGLKSTSTVHSHLTRLQKKGLLNRDPMKPRAMEVIGSSNYARGEVLPIPIVGRVAAGTPILAQENIEDHMLLPLDLLGEGEHFILEVRGDSMINAGILNGDYVVVHKQPDAYNGEIIVAMVEDDATVKRLYKEPNRFRLQPENDAMEPIYAQDVTVLGKVVSLYRRM